MADISKIILPNGDEYNLKDASARSKIPFYGICTSAAETSNKIVTIDDTNFQLITGTVVNIVFSNTNTAENVTLNINSTGAIYVGYNESRFAGKNPTICGRENCTNTYVYNGTYWMFLNDSLIPILDLAEGELSLIS